MQIAEYLKWDRIRAYCECTDDNVVEKSGKKEKNIDKTFQNE